VLHHHSHWDELKQTSLSRRDVRMANLIFLSDRIDVRAASHYHSDILLARDEIFHGVAAEHRGTLFDPELVDALQEAMRFEALWLGLEDRHIERYAWDMGRIASSRQISLDQLRQVAMILAYVVDQKSPFTARHSVGVADLSKYLATSYGLGPEQCIKVEIAGLLHDLGKLHTPDRILEKPGPLTATEQSIMNQHSYETYEILRHIEGLDDIARWAAYHHEGVNGGGYPFHPQRRELSVEARLIAVADVFQALAQDRPYRKGLPLSDILTELDRQASTGRLDPNMVALAKEQQARCHAIAQGTDDWCNHDYTALLHMQS
jgi:putative nucleotidyltransferase with HDIG domain